MTRRAAIATVLVLVGGSVTLYGMGVALVEFGGLYSDVLAAPMEDPAGGERGVSERMLRGVLIGMCGVPPLLVGSVMLGAGLIGRLLKKSAKQCTPKRE